MPQKEHIVMDNVIWQVLELSKGFVKLLNAYVDMRQNLSIVRVNVQSGHDLNVEKDSIFCQLWFEGASEPLWTRATEFFLLYDTFWRYDPNNTRPYLITCPFKFEGKFPKFVSLTREPCDNAENLLEVLNAQPENGVKKKFGVCSKQIYYTDRKVGIRLIEWIHLLQILGADKIFFSIKYLHRDVYQLVKYFEEQGIVETWPFLEPSGVSDTKLNSKQTYILENAMLTDCFFRIMNLYEYVVVLDIDEVIMPVNPLDMNWSDMMKRISEGTHQFIDGYRVLWTFYPDIGINLNPEIPSYHYILQHTQRSINYAKLMNDSTNVKSLFSTDRSLFIHNHSPLACINQEYSCTNYNVSTDIAHTSHYRSSVIKKYVNTTTDLIVWKFKEKLIEKVAETLKNAKFIP